MRRAVIGNLVLAFWAMHGGDALSADAARSSGAKVYGDAARGRSVVDKWCVSCHSAGPVADDRVPTLGALASNPSRTEGAVRAFLMQPHRPMPPLELSTQQIEDILAYLRSVRVTGP